jgi:hypothetical protein
MAVEENDTVPQGKPAAAAPEPLPLSPPGGIERRFPRGTPLQRRIAAQHRQSAEVLWTVARAAARDTETPGR